MGSNVAQASTVTEEAPSFNTPGVKTLRAGDEEASRKRVVSNLERQAWKDWPNDAAFLGLDEHRGPIPLRITGYIPSWAAGTLYRTGPGLSELDTYRGKHRVSHWFDGFAHTHRFDIVAAPGSGSASVTYSSRQQSDDMIEQIRTSGWRASTSFGQRADPCVGIFAKAMSLFQPRSYNNNVVVQVDAPGYPCKASNSKTAFLATDNSCVQEVDAATLEPIGYATQDKLHPELSGPLSCAHAQRDPDSGDLFNYNLELGRQPMYRVFRVDGATGTTEILARIPVTPDPDSLRPAYIHSFFLTAKYVVLCVPGSHYGWSGLKIPWERNLLEAVEPWDDGRKCQWAVVDKGGKGVVGRFSSPAGFFFHSVNAYEEVVHGQEELVLDSIQYPNSDIMTSFYYDVLLDRDDAMAKHWLSGARSRTCQPSLVRHRYRMGESEATTEFNIPGPHAGDLPTINPSYHTKPHRFVYSVPTRGLSTLTDSLAKTDVATRECRLWCGPQGHSPGEPIFVLRPGAEEEDDGVLLSLVLDGERRASYLLCLDARTMDEVGRAEADFAIAMGFHGAHRED